MAAKRSAASFWDSTTIEYDVLTKDMVHTREIRAQKVHFTTPIIINLDPGQIGPFLRVVPLKSELIVDLNRENGVIRWNLVLMKPVGWPEFYGEAKLFVRQNEGLTRDFSDIVRGREGVFELRRDRTLVVRVILRVENAGPPVKKKVAGMNLELEYNRMTDFVLLAEGGEDRVNVHRVALLKNSDILALLLLNNVEMREYQTNTDRNVLEKLVKFLYSDIKVSASTLIPLWTAADNYGFASLKIHFQNLMVRAIRGKNAEEFLQFAMDENIRHLVTAAARELGKRSDADDDEDGEDDEDDKEEDDDEEV